MTPAFMVYLAGVAIGLLRSDAPWRTRVALAALWPIGPAAFAITVSLLLVASLVAFPILGVTVALAAGLTAWILM
jgi:hypothetical protein